MAELSKEERRRRIKVSQDAERAELLAKMPLSPGQLNSLLDYLDANLKGCDHTTKLTDIFLHVEKLQKGPVLEWLRDHGGYCDCEVLMNLEDLADSLQDRPPPQRPPKKKKNEPRDLASVTGWNLSSLPKPWRVGNLYDSSEPIRLQIGKKSDFSVSVMEASLPISDVGDDASWIQLWYSLTDLPEGAPIEITRDTLKLPDGLRSTLASSPDWVPVYYWIYPDDGSWYVQVRTELRRQRGDLPQIYPLIAHLETNRA